MSPVPDLAQIRFDNAVALFDEFVRNTVKHPDAATLRGLERRFAERVQIQPSYWSQIKARSRQIGERLARQFEQLCHKPYGWMDQWHGGAAPPIVAGTGAPAAPAYASQPAPAPAPADSHAPQDDDERFIMGLVLTYYRRHPQRARTRLLDLLGEVLTPPADNPAPAALAGQASAPKRPPQPGKAASAAKPAPAPTDDAHALWLRSQSGVAPLKHKKK
jgi:hypothetical protein